MKYESIRPYHDNEVNQALLRNAKHPMMLALLDYAFPEKNEAYYLEKLQNVHSTYSFHKDIVYPALKRVLKETTESLTTRGFKDLDKDKPYLYISNHRDIVLDTSLTNLILLEKDMQMMASAIGDNLVGTDFLMDFAKINRNFLVSRSLPPREMLEKSKELSEFIRHLLDRKHSVWVAQREGRTKDGNDTTHPGVIKMLAMARPKTVNVYDYLIDLNIVPVTISYEYDPTDYMKMPAILAALNGKKYTKTKNEDFNNIMKGVLGYKKNVHITCGQPLKDYLMELKKADVPANKGIRAFAQKITNCIQQQYKLHPTNYIAYDMYKGNTAFSENYTPEEYKNFEIRMEKSLGGADEILRTNFLLMYANPVINILNKSTDNA